MYEPGHNYYERLQRSGNVLITKSFLGQSKPSIVPLPPPNFIFGQTRPRDKEGVGEVITSWEIHQASKPPQPPRDFKALNVLSLRSGLHTSKSLTKFRSFNDAKIKIREGKPLPPIPIPEMTFGIKVRPSTPMQEVLSYAYGRAACEQRHEMYGLSKSFTKAPDLTLANTMKCKSEDKKAFKMKKFSETAAKTNTFLRKKTQGSKSFISLDSSKVSN